MESQKPKIVMYARRSFGDKLTASFDFIRENWKPLLKYSTYLILPVCLIQALSLDGLLKSTVGLSSVDMTKEYSAAISQTVEFFVYYALYFCVAVIGGLLISSLVYALIRTYNEREERLEGVNLKSLKPMLLHNIKKLFALGVLGFLWVFFLSIVVVALGIASAYTLILTIPLLIACIVPLTLSAPICLFEDAGALKAIKKAYYLGFATWGGVFMVMLVMGLVASVLQGVTTTPWYIATVVKMLFTESDAGSTATVSPIYGFFLYLLGVVQAFGGYIAMIFSLVGSAYQYGHASEKMDGVRIESDIENFDKF